MNIQQQLQSLRESIPHAEICALMAMDGIPVSMSALSTLSTQDTHRLMEYATAFSMAFQVVERSHTMPLQEMRLSFSDKTILLQRIDQRHILLTQLHADGFSGQAEFYMRSFLQTFQEAIA